MSDEAAQHFEQKETPEPAKAAEGRSVTLSVTLQPNGQIDFSLPLNNKILAYGLVEVARAQLDKMYLMNEMKQAKQAKAEANGVAGLLKRMGGG